MNTRLVFARATVECVDNDGDIVDVHKTWPYFEEWARTNGLVLAAHVSEPVVGNIVFWTLRREPLPTIAVVIEITHQKAWQYCLAGKFTGLSIGGKSFVLWDDTVDGVTGRRIVAMPTELSLVLEPTCQQAQFDVLYESGRWIAPAHHKEVRTCDSIAA